MPKAKSEPAAPAKRRRKAFKNEGGIFKDVSALFRGRFEQDFDFASFQAIASIRIVAQLITDCTNQWLAPFGLTWMKYSCLLRLYVEPGQRLSLNELSRYANTTNASVTSMINALEKGELVRRIASTEDRRSIIAELTPRGRSLIGKASPVHIANVNRAFRGIPLADRKAISTLLNDVGIRFESRFGAAAEETK